MGRLFGTDGVRGVAGVDLTAELATSLAIAAAAELAGTRPAGGAAQPRPAAVVGRDPRPSGEMLEAAVTAGLLATGMDVVRLGVLPTPAVAHAMTAPPVGERRPALGIMISASHNPMPDNGIKIFGPGGTKLDDAAERRIEAAVGQPAARVSGAAMGRVIADLDGDVDWYVDHLVATVPAPLDGLRIVVDCANGAAIAAAPAAYRKAGADVVVINDDRSGYGINDGCGATHLQPLQEAVRAHGAAAGLAHDGDADRCLAVDATGAPLDGDQILAVLALALKERHALRGDAVAATVMSNLGFHRAMAEHGIRVAETAVGDRYVLERMKAEGLALGGEQSGHVIMADLSCTGDGILTGLHLLSRVAETRRSLADLGSVVRRLPQVLVNVAVSDPSTALAAAEQVAEKQRTSLAGDGRILVRASGTEPVIRVMVEAATEDQAQAVADLVAAAVASPG